MHVRSSGDPVEIGERDNLTICCDISGAIIATTHTFEMPMSIPQSRQDKIEFI